MSRRCAFSPLLAFQRAQDQDFLQLLLEFVTALGIVPAVRLFASNCFSARAQDQDFLQLFLD
jgi:hypothetical protein